MRSSLPVRSPWRLSWKMVKRMALLPREELGERHVDRLQEGLLDALLLGLLHQLLLQLEGGLRPLHVVDRQARLDDRVELVGIGLLGELPSREHLVGLLAVVARL